MKYVAHAQNKILFFLSVDIRMEVKRYCRRVVVVSCIKHTFDCFFFLKMRILLVFVFVVLSCLLECVHANRTIIVPTKYGDVMGVETSLARIFYGIPFAQPPVGDLRYFKKNSSNYLRLNV